MLLQDRAAYMATQIGAAFHSVFSASQVLLSITGTTSVPSPYTGTDSTLGVFNLAALITDLQAKYLTLFVGGAGSAYGFAQDEAQAYSLAIEAYFSSATFPLAIASGNTHDGVLSAVTLPVSTLKTEMAPLLLAVYSEIGSAPSSPATKADAVATVIDNALQNWLSGITFSGTVTNSPAGPLTGGAATGNFT